MDELDFLLEEFLLEAENDDSEQTSDTTDSNASEDNSNNEEEQSSEENNEENSEEENNTNNDDNSSEPEQPEDSSETPNTDDSGLGDTSEEENNDDTTEDDTTEEEPKVNKNKLLIYFDNFDELINLTDLFLDKVNELKIKIQDQDKRMLYTVETALNKQKDDLNYLLTKKISSISEENLDKLLLVFKTKIETLVDIIKSTFKDT